MREGCECPTQTLQPSERENESIGIEYSFFRRDGGHGRIGGGTLTKLAEDYDAHGEHKLGTSSMHILWTAESRL